jgi:hypothetical protein
MDYFDFHKLDMEKRKRPDSFESGRSSSSPPPELLIHKLQSQDMSVNGTPVPGGCRGVRNACQTWACHDVILVVALQNAFLPKDLNCTIAAQARIPCAVHFSHAAAPSGDWTSYSPSLVAEVRAIRAPL